MISGCSGFGWGKLIGFVIMGCVIYWMLKVCCGVGRRTTRCVATDNQTPLCATTGTGLSYPPPPQYSTAHSTSSSSSQYTSGKCEYTVPLHEPWTLVDRQTSIHRRVNLLNAIPCLCTVPVYDISCTLLLCACVGGSYPSSGAVPGAGGGGGFWSGTTCAQQV